PVVFDAEDVRETKKLDEVQNKADQLQETFQAMTGYGPEGWVPTERYELVLTLCKQLKDHALSSDLSAEEWAEVAAHWPFDNMDEEKYN
ncbi:hypothetical protein FA95DRAFT_1490296, partial [Auriscalpium vulgare]